LIRESEPASTDAVPPKPSDYYTWSKHFKESGLGSLYTWWWSCEPRCKKTLNWITFLHKL